jgi:hypothetical protein
VPQKIWGWIFHSAHHCCECHEILNPFFLELKAVLSQYAAALGNDRPAVLREAENALWGAIVLMSHGLAPQKALGMFASAYHKLMSSSEIGNAASWFDTGVSEIQSFVSSSYLSEPPQSSSDLFSSSLPTLNLSLSSSAGPSHAHPSVHSSPLSPPPLSLDVDSAPPPFPSVLPSGASMPSQGMIEPMEDTQFFPNHDRHANDGSMADATRQGDAQRDDSEAEGLPKGVGDGSEYDGSLSPLHGVGLEFDAVGKDGTMGGNQEEEDANEGAGKKLDDEENDNEGDVVPGGRNKNGGDQGDPPSALEGGEVPPIEQNTEGEGRKEMQGENFRGNKDLDGASFRGVGEIAEGDRPPNLEQNQGGGNRDAMESAGGDKDLLSTPENASGDRPPTPEQNEEEGQGEETQIDQGENVGNAQENPGPSFSGIGSENSEGDEPPVLEQNGDEKGEEKMQIDQGEDVRNIQDNPGPSFGGIESESSEGDRPLDHGEDWEEAREDDVNTPPDVEHSQGGRGGEDIYEDPSSPLSDVGSPPSGGHDEPCICAYDEEGVLLDPPEPDHNKNTKDKGKGKKSNKKTQSKSSKKTKQKTSQKADNTKAMSPPSPMFSSECREEDYVDAVTWVHSHAFPSWPSF